MVGRSLRPLFRPSSRASPAFLRDRVPITIIFVCYAGNLVASIWLGTLFANGDATFMDFRRFSHVLTAAANDLLRYSFIISTSHIMLHEFDRLRKQRCSRLHTGMSPAFSGMDAVLGVSTGAGAGRRHEAGAAETPTEEGEACPTPGWLRNQSLAKASAPGAKIKLGAAACIVEEEINKEEGLLGTRKYLAI